MWVQKREIWYRLWAVKVYITWVVEHVSWHLTYTTHTHWCPLTHIQCTCTIHRTITDLYTSEESDEIAPQLGHHQTGKTTFYSICIYMYMYVCMCTWQCIQSTTCIYMYMYMHVCGSCCGVWFSKCTYACVYAHMYTCTESRLTVLQVPLHVWKTTKLGHIAKVHHQFSFPPSSVDTVTQQREPARHNFHTCTTSIGSETGHCRVDLEARRSQREGGGG